MTHSLLYEKLNLETARISWQELQPYFARGVVFAVDNSLDLPDVARQMAADNVGYIRKLVGEKRITEPDAATARQWYENNCEMWAVVVAPWVLVQAISLH